MHNVLVMLPYTNYIVWKQNVLIKPHTCTSHTGKENSLDSSQVSVTHAVVLKLVEGLEGKGNHIYMDNYYSSPTLFSDWFGACGAVRMN